MKTSSIYLKAYLIGNVITPVCLRMGHFYKNDYKSNMDNVLLRKTFLAAI